MSSKMFVVTDPAVGSLLSLIAMALGAVVEEYPSPTVTPIKEEFDTNTYVKPNVPKTLVTTVPSNTKPGKTYYVRKDKEDNLYCTCLGFTFRGKCRHIDKVKLDLTRKTLPLTFPVTGIPVQSFSSINHPGTIYTVKIKGGDYVCTCRGFNFHGECKHIRYAARNIQRPIRL